MSKAFIRKEEMMDINDFLAPLLSSHLNITSHVCYTSI